MDEDEFSSLKLYKTRSSGKKSKRGRRNQELYMNGGTANNNGSLAQAMAFAANGGVASGRVISNDSDYNDYDYDQDDDDDDEYDDDDDYHRPHHHHSNSNRSNNGNSDDDKFCCVCPCCSCPWPVPSGVWCVKDVCGLVCAVMTWSLIVFAEFVVMFVIVLPSPYTIGNFLNTLLFQVLAVLAVSSHLAAMLSDPGAVPLGNATQENIDKMTTYPGQVIYRCPRCLSIKPLRAHHCRQVQLATLP